MEDSESLTGRLIGKMRPTVDAMSLRVQNYL
jgi:hypothetical protein